MIATAFACFDHKYSRYEFINFKETILYTKSQLFLLEKDRCIVVIFGTHMENTTERWCRFTFVKFQAVL
jgi:hypothetical protein